MIAPLRQQPPSEFAEAMLAEDARASHPGARHALLAGAMGFFCCMPYLAIPVGNHAALQFGTIFAVIAVIPAMFARNNRGRGLWMVPLLIVPLVTAMLNVGVDGQGSMLLGLKTAVTYASAFLTVSAVQLYASQYSLEILTSVAFATLIHAAIGAYQAYRFSFGEFPLVWMYGNPSFLSVQDNFDTIAKWTQRPFGIFPEPSAMSASLAPAVLLWIAELCGIITLRRRPAVWQRALFALAAVAGLGLIIMSRSGHAAVTLAAALLFLAVWFIRCRATSNSYLAILGVFGVAMPIALYFAAGALETRLSSAKSDLGNSSWEDRSNSLIIGFKLLVDHDLRTLVFGVGLGETSPVLQRGWRLEAVWSVLLTYVYETGVLGLLVVSLIGYYLVKVGKRIGWNVAFVSILIVWLVGVTLTTSYFELLMLWVMLGWLSLWPAIYQPAWEAAEQAADETSANPMFQHLAKSRFSRGANPARNWVPLGWRDPGADVMPADPSRPAGPRTPDVPKRWSDWS